jgi:mannose-6-phosphate isomerase
LGEQVPSAAPQAELWIGAHPSSPSEIVGGSYAGSLIDLIQADPHGTVGPDVTDEFGARLPFLLKVLAADAPLSLQVHPTAQQARSGFASEEAGGLPADAPQRNYKDAWHKPEMICALTEFRALGGFRTVGTTLRLLRLLRVGALNPFIDVLVAHPDARGIRDVVARILDLDEQARRSLCRAVAAACADWIGMRGEFDREFRNVLNLAGRYPGDPGVLVALLMNHVTLQPGQAIYVPAGNLHAYLSGVGVEIMASSDNVLRGGLTAKHVDVPELLGVLDFSTGPSWHVGEVAGADGEWVYPTPSAEFQLSRIEVASERLHELEHSGPQILLAVAGEVSVADDSGAAVTITSGRSVFVPARVGRVRLSGTGTVFRARDGLGQFGAGQFGAGRFGAGRFGDELRLTA